MGAQTPHPMPQTGPRTVRIAFPNVFLDWRRCAIPSTRAGTRFGIAMVLFMACFVKIPEARGENPTLLYMKNCRALGMFQTATFNPAIAWS